MHFSGFMLNLQDLKNTSKFSSYRKKIYYVTEEHAKSRRSSMGLKVQQM